jgi:TPR repeat protein
MRVLAMDGPRDERKAAGLYAQAFQLGDLDACHRGGHLYQEGSRDPGAVKKSCGKAAAIYKEGCDRGSGTCCSDLAWLYQTGCGVPKDKKRAKDLLRKAEQLGWVGGD